MVVSSSIKDLVEEAYGYRLHQQREEIERFCEWLVKREPNNVLEIGGLHGGTAILWLGIATGKVISVDLPDGRFGGLDHGLNEDRCLLRNEHLHDRSSRYHGVLGDSHDPATVREVRKVLNGEFVDMLFIDGDHTYAGVSSDFELYKQFVSRNGCIALHDINDTPMHRAAGCRVDQLWKDIISAGKIEFNIHGEWGGIGVVVL